MVGRFPLFKTISNIVQHNYIKTQKRLEISSFSSLFIHLECKFCTCFELNDLLSSDRHLLASCWVTTFASSTL